MSNLSGTDAKLLICSGYGDMCGWDVFDGENLLCSLLYHSEDDMFWTRYCIYSVDPISSDICNDRFWVTSQFSYRSRAVESFVLSDVICRYNERDKLISARGLHIQIPVGLTTRAHLIYRALRG